MQHGAKPGDIADMTVMMVAKNYLTCKVLLVDGGLHLT